MPQESDRCVAIRFNETEVLAKRLRTASSKTCPRNGESRWGESLAAEKMDQCRWVKPKLVCQGRCRRMDRGESLEALQGAVGKSAGVAIWAALERFPFEDRAYSSTSASKLLSVHPSS
jgi:hypothetical protein